MNSSTQAIISCMPLTIQKNVLLLQIHLTDHELETT